MQISDEHFEKFCTDMADALPEFAHVRRHGRRGDRQDGIDAAGDRAGRHVALQYRRVQNFGPKGFKDTVEYTTYPADEYVLTLGSRASARLRKAVTDTPGWELWDADEIARLVRKLPDTVARRLVETYFGAHQRRAFLGRTGPAAFHTLEDHFEPMMRDGLLFDHRLPLVGRGSVIGELQAFVAEPALSIAVLPGRGGIGKTRVLKAMAERIDPVSWTVLFADEHTHFDASSLDDIPPEPCVLFVDDGHRRRDLGELIAYLARRQWPTKLVIATRPEGRSALLSLLNESAVDTRSVKWLRDVPELPRDQGEDLARAALGEDRAQFAGALYAVTRDCTMVMVVGARLLRQRQIPPTLLERDQEFRDTVLIGFRDASLGRVSASVPSELARRTLELVSALQPVSPESEEFRQSAADFLGVPASEFVRALDRLEEAAVLLRRGYSLRVVPDVLADYVLGTACLTRAGAPTGYAEELFRHFASVSFDRLLANLAEIDWRVRRTTGAGTPLLDNIWKVFSDCYRKGDNVERQRLLGMLRSAAPYQPERILALAEWTVVNSAPDGAVHDIRVDRHDGVVSMLPKLIEDCAYGEHLGRACELLWRLGRGDVRAMNQFPDHPITVLTRIAACSPTKPLEESAQVADQALVWLEDPAVHTYAHSPLDVLETLLAKEGLYPVSEGHHVRFGHIQVSPEVTRELRAKVIRRALRLVVSGHPRVALRAVRLLDAGLSDPIGFFGREVSQEEKHNWEDEQVQILLGLRQAATHVTRPIVQLRVADAARWSAARGHTSAIREAAKSVRTAIPDNFELRLTRGLTTPWFWESEMAVEVGVRKPEAERIRRLKGVATEMVARWHDPADLADQVGRRLEAIALAGISVEPGYILTLACEGNGKLAAGLAQFIVQHPGHATEVVLAAVLRELRRVDEPTALSIADGTLDAGRKIPCLQVASLYGPVPWTQTVSGRDRDLLTRILGSEEGLARATALAGVETLAKDDVAGAKAMVLAADPGTDACEAEALAGLVAPGSELFAALGDDEVDVVVAKFSSLSTVETYHTQALLAGAARRRPLSVARMLLARIDVSRQRTGDSRYHALPFEIPGAEWWSCLDPERRSPVLIELRNATLPPTPERVVQLAELFGWVAGDWGDDAQDVVLDWLESRVEDKVVAAAQLLRAAPRELVFDRPGFIGRVLAAVAATSPRASSVASGALHSAAYHTGRHRRLTIASAQDVWVRDRARQAAEHQPAGSLLGSLYDDIAGSAEQMMERKRMADAEMLEGLAE